MYKSHLCFLAVCLIAISSCGKKSTSDDVKSPNETDSLGIAQNVVPSYYGIKIREAIAQAEKDDKVVWVEIGGAWCDPCNIQDTMEEEFKDELAPAMQNVIRVHVEQMYNVRLIASDVVNIGYVRYPSNLLYSPKFKTWSYVLAPARYFKRVIPYFKQFGEVGGLLTSDMQERMAKPDAFNIYNQTDDSAYQNFLIHSLLFEGKAKEAAEFIQKMKAYDVKYGLNTIPNTLDIYASNFAAALDRGILSEKDLADNFPGYEDLKARNIELQVELNFHIAITNLAKTSGTQVAAEACLQKHHDVFDVTPKPRVLDANATDAERNTAKIQDARDLATFNRLANEYGIQCETLRIEHKLSASDLSKTLEKAVESVSAHMSSTDLSFRDTSKYSRLAILKARQGDFATAKALIAQALVFADAQSKVATTKIDYQAKVQVLETKLATATTDDEKVALRAKITSDKYIIAAEINLETNTRDTLKRLLAAFEAGQVLPN